MPDRSAAIVREIITAMAQAGWRECVVREQLLDPRNRGGAKLQALDPADAEREIHRVYEEVVAELYEEVVAERRALGIDEERKSRARQ